jgi:succinyl-CoA synthetase beta subunit/citryl-CoA synthetase large subunit
MRLIEWEAKALLRAQGISVPDGVRIRCAEQAAQATVDLGRSVMVKAQVPCGRRMKAGGVRVAANASAARQAASELLGGSVWGFPIEEVLVEPQVPPGHDLFVAITYDDFAKTAVILASTAGGIEIEQTAQHTPGSLVRQAIDVGWPFSAYKAREVAAAVGLTGRSLLSVSDVVRRLYELFLRYDAVLVEVNPLRLSPDSRCVALDAHIELDDDAMSRHPELESCWCIQPRSSQPRPPTAFEEAAARIDAADHRGVAGRVVEFDGDLGLLIGGGGASLTVFDAILSHGGHPANYCEIGGNPSVRKIRDLTQLILGQPGVQKLAVIMNVVSNTRADLVARGVIKGIVELGLEPRDTLVVFRVPGSWEDESIKILRHYGIPYCDRSVSLDEAARLAVERGRS